MNLNIQRDAQAKTTNLLFFLGILIFTYTFLRAGLMSITWDESQSYHEYIKNHIVLTDRYDFMSANNHILNTLGGIFFTELFGVSEFSLRMTSLVAHLFFLFYSAKLVRHFDNRWITASAFLIINLNPFLLDFFSLSRGYSISLGMMMASIYYLYVFIKGHEARNAFWALVFSMLATLGNLTLLNYSLILFGLLALLHVYEYISNKQKPAAAIKGTISNMLLPALLFALFLWFILPISFGLRAAGALFMGGENGFWKDTMGTIVPRLWYEWDFTYWLQRITKVIFVAIFISAAGYAGYRLLKKRISANILFLASLVMILFLIILSTVAQHHLLGTLYLIERTVLFLFVLLMLIFVFLVNDLAPMRKHVGPLLHITAGLFVIHFLLSFNLKHVYEWKDDSETKQMLADLSKIRQQPQEKFNLSIGVPLALESSINYYRGVNGLSWLNEAFRSTRINHLNDYFFLRPSEVEKTNMDSLDVIKTYPRTKNVLAKPKYPFTISTVLVDSTHEISRAKTPFAVSADLEYTPGFVFSARHEWLIRNSVLSCQIEFEAVEPFRDNVYYIVACEGKAGIYEWKPMRLNDFWTRESGRATANFTTFIPEQMQVGDKITIYLWNPWKQQFLIHKMRLKWIHYARESK